MITTLKNTRHAFIINMIIIPRLYIYILLYMITIYLLVIIKRTLHTDSLRGYIQAISLHF